MLTLFFPLLPPSSFWVKEQHFIQSTKLFCSENNLHSVFTAAAHCLLSSDVLEFWIILYRKLLNPQNKKNKKTIVCSKTLANAVQPPEREELNSSLSVWLLVITNAIQNSGATTTHLPQYFIQTPTGVKREQHFSEQLPAGTERMQQQFSKHTLKAGRSTKGTTA